MKSRSWSLVVALVVAILGFWLLLAGPERVLGIDPGNAGIALLMASVWGALYALYTLPRGDIEAEVSPGEWRAWIGTAFMAQLVAYLLLKAEAFRGGEYFGNADASAVGRNVVMLLIAWTILSSVMASRWKDQVQEDERDREIRRVASGWGSGAVTFCIIGIAVMLGLSPAEKLGWASHLVIAHLLIFALVWGGLVEYFATAVQYLRDRR